jgi:hypothetical protein
MLSEASPRFAPEIVTEVPVPPELGETPLIAAAAKTRKLIELLASPLTVTISGPLVAPAGTLVPI